jgi:hypothetical protein
MTLPASSVISVPLDLIERLHPCVAEHAVELEGFFGGAAGWLGGTGTGDRGLAAGVFGGRRNNLVTSINHGFSF